MNLKQRFLTQSTITLIITIIITVCVGYAYAYFYDLFNKSSVSDGIGETITVIIRNDNIIYNEKEFSNLQIKEMMMNLSVDNNHYNYENTTFDLNEKKFYRKYS